MVVGGRASEPSRGRDIRRVGATLSANRVIEEAGVSAAAAGVTWLVNKLAPLGAGLEAGQIVLAGSFTRPVSVAAGDVVHADHGPLGTIRVSFA